MPTQHSAESYAFIHGLSISTLADNIDVQLKPATYPDYLFFVLFQMKNGLSYDSPGLLIIRP